MALQDPNIMPSSRLDCPLSLETAHMGNTGFLRFLVPAVHRVLSPGDAVKGGTNGLLKKWGKDGSGSVSALLDAGNSRLG